MNTILARVKFYTTHNIGLKLLALFLAAASWYGIRKAISFEVTTPDVRLEITPPPGYAVQYQSEASIDVTFLGSQEDIRFLDVKQLEVAVGLKMVDADGPYEVFLAPEHVMGARGVRPIRLNPTRVRVELDREDEKQVPVRPRIVGRPLSGQVESSTSDPATVTLRGPARKLRQIDQVMTAPIDVDGRIESFARRVPILQPSDAWAARIAPSETMVEVIIAVTPAQRDWPQQPVLALLTPGSRYQVTIEPARVDITLTGKAETLDRLTDYRPRVTVDCTALKPNADYELPVHVTPPDLDVEIHTDPPGVRVTIQEF